MLPGGSARTPRAEARSVGIRMSFFVLVVDIYVCKVRGSLETGTELPQMTLGERVRMRIEVETHHKKHFVTALSSHTPPHRHHARLIGARHDRTAAGRRVRPVLVAKSAGRDTPGLPHGTAHRPLFTLGQARTRFMAGARRSRSRGSSLCASRHIIKHFTSTARAHAVLLNHARRWCRVN